MKERTYTPVANKSIYLLLLNENNLKKFLTIWCIVFWIANKGPSSQSYGLSISHVWMWELDHEEGWAL